MDIGHLWINMRLIKNYMHPMPCHKVQFGGISWVCYFTFIMLCYSFLLELVNGCWKGFLISLETFCQVGIQVVIAVAS